MSKTYRTLIIGGSLNSTSWTTGSKTYPSVSLILQKESNIFIKGVKLLKYSMSAFEINMDPEDDEDSS